MAKASSRVPIITGNWKMYKTIQEALSFIKTLAPLIEKSQARVCLATPFTAIQASSKLIEELKAPIEIGAQNMNDASEGAFTGEIAAKMLKEAGAHFVIIGHSERRHLFGETDAFINKKIKRAFAENIQPVLCVGETLDQREHGQTEAILKNQLLASLADIDAKNFDALVIAYEPVWAIGTGRVASSKDAEKAHAFCREVIGEKWGDDCASKVMIQYGGSVKPENAKELLDGKGIDGLLIGGASLNAESFSQIVNAYQPKERKKAVRKSKKTTVE